MPEELASSSSSFSPAEEKEDEPRTKGREESRGIAR
jgi:hypothetical protein